MSKHTLWETLSCDLNQDEINLYSQELANVTTEQAEVEAHKKDVLSGITARLNKCAADRVVLARKITSRKEDRPVECELEFDYAAGKVYTVRVDTGVTIRQRKLSDDERQQWLDLDAEEGRRQEAADKREEATPDNVIEGELLQIEHKVEDVVVADPDEYITICGNKDCEEYDTEESNHCLFCENVWECEKAVNGASETEFTVITNEEGARRDEICKQWRFCDHKAMCFTPENEEAGICFVDSPEKLPKDIDTAKETFARQVNKLVVTSADDCKTSLLYVSDMAVLHEALERCTVSGEKTKAKHISARINMLEKAVA